MKDELTQACVAAIAHDDYLEERRARRQLRKRDDLEITESDLEWLDWFRDKADDDDSNERLVRDGRRQKQ